MANRYANLPGPAKISETYQYINTGFDKVEQEMDEKADGGDLTSLETTVDNHIGSRGDAHGNATQTESGFMSAADKEKINHIEAEAEKNQNAFAKVNDLEADSPSDELSISGGTGITVTTNPNTNEVNITATGESTPGPHGTSHLEHGSDPIPLATETDGGLMSAEDKQKLTDLEDLPGELVDLAGEGRTTETVKGNADALAVHQAETITDVFNAVEGYNADNTGSFDTVSELQAAHDAIASSGQRGLLYMPRGIYKIDSTLTIDLSYVSILCEGEIDATGITSGTAIQFIGTVVPPYRQSMIVVDGIKIVGNDRYGTVKGMSFDSSAPTIAGPSHTSFRNCNISQFGTGLYFKDRSYAQNFYGFDVFNCSKCIESPASVTDGGERMTFHGCIFFNSDLALDVKNPNSDWCFTACSFDYNRVHFEISQAKVFLNQCHIEANKAEYTSTPIKVSGNGGCLVMHGGWFLQGGTAAANDYVVECTDYSAGVYFDGVFMNNTKSATPYFATGAGFVKISNSMSYGTSNNNRLLSHTMSLLADGGFEQTTIWDNIFITGDTEPITNPLVGENIILTTSDDEARSGSRSLKVSKIGAGGATFAIAVSISKGAKPAHEWFFKKSGSQTGTMFLDVRWATVRNKEGVPVLLRAQSFSSREVVFTSDPMDWTIHTTGEPTLRVPNWATHYVINVNITNVGAGDLYFDDLLVTEM